MMGEPSSSSVRASGADFDAQATEALAARLARFPKLTLGSFPSPVREVVWETGKTFWVKDDGRCSPAYGGNKVRKLEFLFGAMARRGTRTIVAHGDVESHTVQAAGVWGRRTGHEVHGVVFPHRRQSFTAPEIRRLQAAGVVVHRRRTMLGAVLHAHWLAWRRKAELVPLGATTTSSCLGYVGAVLELEVQVASGLLPEPAILFVPFATGGTAAGLLVGLGCSRLATRVVAVRTVERLIANERRLREQVRSTVELLGLDRTVEERCLARLDRIDVSQLGSGYRDATERSLEAVARARACGLELEPAFSGKCLASLLEALRTRQPGPLLFWNTHDQNQETGFTGGAE